LAAYIFDLKRVKLSDNKGKVTDTDFRCLLISLDKITRKRYIYLTSTIPLFDVAKSYLFVHITLPLIGRLSVRFAQKLSFYDGSLSFASPETLWWMCPMKPVLLWCGMTWQILVRGPGPV